MIGLVLVTHSQLAQELVYVLEHIVGPQNNIETVCIDSDDNMEERRTEILAVVDKVDTGKGAVVLTDLFGGTPSNLAISIMDRANVEIIAGVNLPMLIKLVSVRNEKSLDKAVSDAQEAGRKYINIASQILKKDEKEI